MRQFGTDTCTVAGCRNRSKGRWNTYCDYHYWQALRPTPPNGLPAYDPDGDVLILPDEVFECLCVEAEEGRQYAVLHPCARVLVSSDEVTDIVREALNDRGLFMMPDYPLSGLVAYSPLLGQRIFMPEVDQATAGDLDPDRDADREMVALPSLQRPTMRFITEDDQ